VQTGTSSTLIELIDAGILSAKSGADVIDGVNWQLRTGDRWVIVGSYGAGKSDLLATAAGLQKPVHGVVQAFGRNIATLKDSELQALRMRIGIVFKNGGRIFSQMTVAENIALPIRYQFNWSFSQAEKSVETLLKLTGLEAHANSTANMLGASWLQRVGLARALSLKPEMLFFDEPLNGLDSRHRHWWLEFLEQLSAGLEWNDKRPTTIAVTTNDPDFWNGWGHQFAHIENKHWFDDSIKPSGKTFTTPQKT